MVPLPLAFATNLNEDIKEQQVCIAEVCRYHRAKVLFIWAQFVSLEAPLIAEAELHLWQRDSRETNNVIFEDDTINVVLPF